MNDDFIDLTLQDFYRRMPRSEIVVNKQDEKQLKAIIEGRSIRFSTRTKQIVLRYVKSIDQLRDEEYLMSKRGCGISTILEIREKLASVGIDTINKVKMHMEPRSNQY